MTPRLAWAAGLLASAVATGDAVAAKDPWDRLSDEIFKHPGRASARLLSRSEGLFTEGLLIDNQAYFMMKARPVANLPGMCGAEGIVVILDANRRPTYFETVRRYRPLARRPGVEGAALRSCGEARDGWDFYWAASGRQAARAADFFEAAITGAAEKGPLPFILTCDESRTCGADPRQVLAGLATWRITRVDPAACDPPLECLKVGLRLGTRSQGEGWDLILSGDDALRSVRLANYTSWSETILPAR